MSKPFFFRIESAELMNFATDPEGEGMTLLRFAKELQRGESDIVFIQGIIAETLEFSQKKRDAANKRWSAKHMQTDALHSTAMPEAVTVTEKPLTKDEEEDLRLAEWIYGLILNVAPSAKKPSFSGWANTIRLMRERDNINRHKIAETFKWANGDSFWMTNILSPTKLRDKFPTLEAKMKQDSSNDLTPQQKQAKKTGGAVY